MNSKLINKFVKSLEIYRLISISVFNNNNQTLYRSNIFKGIDKKTTEDSAEIINLSNDSKSINLPNTRKDEFPKFSFESESFQVAANERGTIDLSPSMHANLPQPPNEAIKNHERPYDTIVSLGEKNTKNDKFISEELLDAQKNNNISLSRNLISEERKMWLYCSNETRFNIKMSSDAVELISQGRLTVDVALEYQHSVMSEINKYWLTKMELIKTKSHLELFLPFSPDDEGKINIESLIDLYSLLDIHDKLENISQFLEGKLSYSDMIEGIDAAVRQIVDQWYHDRMI